MTGVVEKLETLQERGRLDLKPQKIEKDVEEVLPANFNASVSIIHMNSSYYELDSPDQIHLDSSDNSDIQIWIKNAENLNLSFNGQKILENISRTGYYSKNPEPTHGWLNLTGNGEVSLSFNRYWTEGSIPSRENVYTVNFPYFENSSREIRVASYR
ncbi:MAG: hypothetical protein H8Z69_00465 [Nanohaloarchaea archaeon]|nr:hypothetical protein [Candidatus Nanohaloarchaea archaeon]